MFTNHVSKSWGPWSSKYSGGKHFVWGKGLASSDQCLPSIALPMLHLPHFALQNEIPHRFLVVSTNPSEKYAQVKLDPSSPILGVKIKNLWNHHLVILDLRVGSMRKEKVNQKKRRSQKWWWNMEMNAMVESAKKSPTKQMEGFVPKL